jgi:hypothetical protein
MQRLTAAPLHGFVMRRLEFMEVNIYVVNVSGFIEVDGQYQKSVTTSHRYVVAASFEAAIATVRKHHPGCEIKGVSLQNHNNGQKVLFAEAVEASA